MRRLVLNKIKTYFLEKSNSYNYYKRQYELNERLKKDQQNQVNLTDQYSSINGLLDKQTNVINSNIASLKIENDEEVSDTLRKVVQIVSDSNRMDDALRFEHNIHIIRQKVADSKKINVVFLLYKVFWSMDALYHMFEEDDMFNVTLVLIPYLDFLGNGDEEQAYETTYSYFKENGYNIIKGYDLEKEATIDLELECSPDIIFYSSNWNGIFPELLRIHFMPKNALTCYVPYGISTGNIFFTHHIHSDMYKLCWKVFCETEYHRMGILKHNKFHLDPAKIVSCGYPKMDGMFLEKYHKTTCNWQKGLCEDKNNNLVPKKRIIWAPHWTFDKSELHFSTFDVNHEFFLNYAKENNNVEWVFRPHPSLKNSLIENEMFTLEEVEAYYDAWDELPNGRCYHGPDYESLYTYTDAMITDSVSFTAEYLFANKPGLRLSKETQDFNDFGREAADEWYSCEGDDFDYIKYFIEKIVVDGEDSKKEERTKFFNNVLMPYNGKTASENIFNYIKSFFI